MPYKDPEREREYQRAYSRRMRAANPEKIRERSRRWAVANPERVRENNHLWYVANVEKARKYKRFHRYGLTETSYEALLTKQGGVCAICRTTEPGGQGAWHIDADHNTKPAKVRGLLCSRHNLGLGLFGHDPGLLLGAVDYLAKPPAWP